MAFTKLEDWSETAASNTEINGIVLSDSTQIDALDNIEREHMSQIAKWLGDDTIASAATTDLGSVPGRYVSITGTTTITALGTIKAGTIKHVKFAGVLTLTHNATSLILPGAANIVTAAGDTATLVSEGSGNWRCVSYQRASTSPSASWETLGKGDLSASSEISLINAGDYVRLKIRAFLTVSTDGATIRFYTRTGGTVDTVVNGYDFLRIYSEAGAVGTNTGTTDFAPITLSNVGNAAREAINFTMEVEGLNKAEYAWMKLDSSETTSAGGRSKTTAEFRRLSTTARDGFLIQPSAGTFSGYYVIEGMRG